MKKKLKDVCTFIGGGTPSKTKEEYWNGGIPWASVKDLQGYYITETIDNISAAGLKNSSANMCEKDDLILATRIAPGRAAIAKIPVAINQDLKIVKSDMSNEWLKYFFKCKESEILQNSGGTTVKGISLDFLGKVEVPIISLDDQIKIAAELDTIQSAIDNKKQQLALLDEAVKSKFVEMFGENPVESGKWKVEKLEDISTVQTGGTPSRNHPEYFEGNIPWITTANLGKNELTYEDAMEYISQDAINNSATKIIPANSLFIGIRVGVGKCSINRVDMCSNQDICGLSGFDTTIINLVFLKKVLDSYSDFFENAKRGTTIKGIKSDTIKKLKIFIPELNIQNQFASFVQQIDKSKFVVKQQITDLQELLDSKMQEYFG